MRCSIQNLTFTYDGSSEPVFPGWSAELDTGWRLGLTGRNGRGKTTLLRLMMGELPHGGQISLPLQPVYFPYSVSDPEDMTLNVMQEAAGGEPEWKLMKEMRLLEVTEDALYRSFSTLSRGEQTKALLCALFAREDAYPLIDEPTNHLDLLGRQAVAEYLRRKDGFLLVSHDRAFLNDCVDHILSINKTGFQVIQGDYDTWEEQFDRQNAYELKRNEGLKKEIGRLNQSARQASQFAQKAEKDKFHVPESVQAAVDRGYAGARSAAMMKRAKAAVQRRERAAEEKSGLLHNVERVGDLKLRTLHHPKQELITVENGAVCYAGREVCRGVQFILRQGERLALTGPNGCGKSSILKTLVGEGEALHGGVRLASGLVVSYVPQDTSGLSGPLEGAIAARGADETLVKAILRNMDFSREQFSLDMRDYSQGQKKKVLLALSLATPAHVYIWDEPLNYIDVLSRRQIEELLLASDPTLLLVEHDRRFLETVMTGEIPLAGLSAT